MAREVPRHQEVLVLCPAKHHNHSLRAADMIIFTGAVHSL